MIQFPFPPTPDIPLDPPGSVFQLLVCTLLPLLWFETIAFVLPEKWRNWIYDLQFGARWKRKEGQ